MENNDSHKISKKLLRYGAVTAALAGVTEASGQIMYTDVDPDEGGAGVLYNLDMDNDNNSDFQLRHLDVSFSGGTLNSVVVGPAADSMSNFSNSILASSNEGFVYPLVLNGGDPISSGVSGWNNEELQYLNGESCSVGNWCDETDKYLGLRFKIGTDVYYGWARLDVATNGESWVIKDYAYNTQPGEPLDAGETDPTMGTEDLLASTVKVVTDNKFIELYNLPSKSAYKLYAISGKEVMMGQTSEENFVIPANGLSNGVYIVQILDENTGDLMRKKIIL
ncbi:Por secretion system C-terminal sorting domain-containing protein [Pustulibacterium marinum]|uniref:Por secretion system C-terminal sorting domain-containing protein n=1 Tax=Pustulibacterium marinum TaxID=1224947 RepID=A0A1I7F099_9FLAO|nr:T9SS type A sorting domain-containing protein [Pustulibacterium marinum]SFU29564.1 Por secretion system C-terminal sorting domain-containing protein [Pustulibacterium marinum]